MKKKIIIIIAAVLLFLLAACMVAYPLFSNWYIEKHAAQLELEYLEQVEKTDDEELRKALEAAQAYNEKIRPGVEDAYSVDALHSAVEDYANLLNLTGNGLMGYVEVPKIGVKLPIYHGTAADVLQNGVGHLLGSSLPVGGPSTHSILSAHSGATSKLFTDLDQMEVGDTFQLKVLGEILTYRVDQIKVVLPEDTDELGVIADRDLCTLSTCTPFGVNSHRLLVRGERIETPEEEEIAEEAPQQAPSTWSTMYIRALVIGVSAAILVGVIIFVILRVRRRKKS